MAKKLQLDVFELLYAQMPEEGAMAASLFLDDDTESQSGLSAPFPMAVATAPKRTASSASLNDLAKDSKLKDLAEQV